MKKKLLSIFMVTLLIISSVIPAYAGTIEYPEITEEYFTGAYVNLIWNDVEHDDNYSIYRSTSANSGYKKIGTSESQYYCDKTVKYGKTYYYKVRISYNGVVVYSKYISIETVFPKQLEKPILKTFTDDDQDCIWLLWDDINGANIYAIYRSTSKDGIFVPMYTSEVGMYCDLNIEQGKRYYYKVQACYYDVDMDDITAGSAPSSWRSGITEKPAKTHTTSSYNTSQTVYITSTGTKYHNYGCQYLRQSCISISKNSAINQGYTACSRCW